MEEHCPGFPQRIAFFQTTLTEGSFLCRPNFLLEILSANRLLTTHHLLVEGPGEGGHQGSSQQAGRETTEESGQAPAHPDLLDKGHWKNTTTIKAVLWIWIRNFFLDPEIFVSDPDPGKNYEKKQINNQNFTDCLL